MSMSMHNSNGPTTGSIFIGHVLSSTPSTPDTKDPGLNSDIALQAAYIIEGIHVVPNKISPPGFGIEGRTTPDIHTRPFTLIISARNVDNAVELVQILTLTITGGCQWIPILPPYNSTAIDHLRFMGDFERCTVIIHGIKLDTHMLSASAQLVLKSVYSDISIPDTAEEEEEILEIDPTAGDTAQLIPRRVLFALHARTNSYSHTLSAAERKLSSHGPDNILHCISSGDASKGSCVVAIEVVAELVGAIFSIEDDDTCADPSMSVRTAAISNLIKIMQECWKSASDGDLKSPSTHEEFSVALGEEAVAVLAGIAMKLLKSMQGDDTEICGNRGYDPLEPDAYRGLCSAVLDCCGTLLVNEFSAQAFFDIGGLTLMSVIARQAPQLPPLLQAKLMRGFVTAMKHLDLLPKLIEPPEIYTDASGSYATDVSVYQTLVLATGNMRESAPAVRYCKEALLWSALSDSCAALCIFSEGLPVHLTVIAEAVSHRVSTTHETGGGGEREDDDRMEEDERRGGDDRAQDCGMTMACALLHALALRGDATVHALLSTLTAYISSRRGREGGNEGIDGGIDGGGVGGIGGREGIDLPLFELLQRSCLIPSLTALTALSQAATELSSLCEWNTPLRGDMEADAELCQQAVVSTVMVLLKLGGGLGLISLASNATAVQLIWQYLSEEESVMGAQSTGELLLLSTHSNGSNGFLSVHPSSVGWIVWLIAYTVSIVDNIVSAYSAIEVLTATPVSGGTMGGSPVKPRALGGVEEKQLSHTRKKLFENVEALNAVTYSVAGCSVVASAVSHFCLREVLAVAEISTAVMSGGSSSIVSSAARVLFLCGLSAESSATQSLSSHAMHMKIMTLAAAVAISLPMSLSELEDSVSAAALSKQVSKSNDPRHRSAKVEVIRSYTDDARLLAERYILQSMPLEGVVDVVDGQGRDETNRPEESKRETAGTIDPIKTIAKCKVIVNRYSKYDGWVKEEGKDQHPSYPGLIVSLRSLLSTLHDNSPGQSNLEALSPLGSLLGTFEAPLGSLSGSPWGSFFDGDLLHDLLNVAEIGSYVLRGSGVSRMRYGDTHSTALDALILTDVAKCIPVDQMLLRNNKGGENSRGNSDTNGARTGAGTSNGVEEMDGEDDSNAVAVQLSDVLSEVETCLDILRSVMGLLLEVLRVTDVVTCSEDTYGADSTNSTHSTDRKDNKNSTDSRDSTYGKDRVGVPDPLQTRVLDVAMECRAAALQTVGEDKAGALGGSVREICALSVGIVSLYCPQLKGLEREIEKEIKKEKQSPDDDSKAAESTTAGDSSNSNSNSSSSSSSNSGSSRTNALVAYISTRSIDRPANCSSNLSLLIELLPVSTSHRNLELDFVDAYSTANDICSNTDDVEENGDNGGSGKGKWSELRDSQAERGGRLFESWERFIWLGCGLKADTPEEVEKQREKEKEEDLFKGSGSMVVPDDPLYLDLSSGKGLEQGGRMSLLTLILFALGSSSWELHRLASMLCTKSMCLGANSAQKISRAIVDTIQRRAALHLAYTAGLEEEREAKEFAPELSLCRLLMLVEALCGVNTLCVAFVQEGLLLPVLQGLKGSSDRNVCILAMQLLTTVHRTLLRITAGQELETDLTLTLNGKKDLKTPLNGTLQGSFKGSFKGTFKGYLRWVTHALSDALVQTLPLALVSFQDSPNGVLLWEQTVLSMSLLPSSAVKRIIETISATITLEGLAVKLWLAFEDSYQQLFEVTELIKLCQAHPEESALQDLAGEDCGQGALQSAHILFTGAICALRAVIEFALLAFLEGSIALPTLAKACRISLSDPKRVVLRYQRAYTMWAVQSRQTSTAVSAGGVDSGRGWKRSAAYAPFVSGSVTDPQCSAAFDARHELISSALRHAVESTGKIAKLVSGREMRPKGGNGIIMSITPSDSSSTISMDFDFYRPFSELPIVGGDALSLWFAELPPSVRLPRLCELRTGSSADTLHTVLRRGMLYGDDSEAPLFDGCVVAKLEAVHRTLTSKRKRVIEPAPVGKKPSVMPPQMPTFAFAPPSIRPSMPPAPGLGQGMGMVPGPGPPSLPPPFRGNAPPPPPPSLPPQHQHQQQQQQQRPPAQPQQHQQQQPFQGRGPPAPQAPPEFHPPSHNPPAKAVGGPLPPPPMPPMRPGGSQGGPHGGPHAPQQQQQSPNRQRW